MSQAIIRDIQVIKGRKEVVDTALKMAEHLKEMNRPGLTYQYYPNARLLQAWDVEEWVEVQVDESIEANGGDTFLGYDLRDLAFAILNAEREGA